MSGLLGRPGSWGGLVLRVGQTFFAAACIGLMGSSLGFASYTAFCYLIASMGLQMLWSFGLACLDGYAITANKDLTSPILLSLFVVGDWLGVILRGKIRSVYYIQSGVDLLFIKL
ncbi:CASP-like protein 5B2 isoform X2 [Miscanthus floridulus]|uniref:CASP-like protein 5B2 isoform X2 n=1 Tax=Miscanthus floridulus TaxID=154761 RepID=UPI00345936A8